MLDLFTCSYTEYKKGMGVPVRTTAGRTPDWFASDPAHAPLLAPKWAFLRKPEKEYRGLYVGMLDGYGVKTIADSLLTIAQERADHRLVLLCFDDLRKPTQWCHRTMFAQWWTEHTGDPCRELGGSFARDPHRGV